MNLWGAKKKELELGKRPVGAAFEYPASEYCEDHDEADTTSLERHVDLEYQKVMRSLGVPPTIPAPAIGVPGIWTSVQPLPSPIISSYPIPDPEHTPTEKEILERLDKLEKMLISLQEDLAMALVEMTNP